MACWAGIPNDFLFGQRHNDSAFNLFVSDGWRTNFFKRVYLDNKQARLLRNWGHPPLAHSPNVFTHTEELRLDRVGQLLLPAIVQK